MSDLSLELDSDLANRISDALSLNREYENQAKEKFEYFRMPSPDVWFKIDVKHLSDDIRNYLNSVVENCKNKNEKYERLNDIFVKAIELFYEKCKPKILETKKHNREEAEQAFTTLPSSISKHWKLVNIDKIPIPDSLAELIGYTPSLQTASLSSLLVSEEGGEEVEETTDQSNDIFTAEDEKEINDIDSTSITSEDIKFVLKTISKQAPHDETQLKQIFYGICSSQTSTKLHHNINSKKSGEGKSFLLKLVVDYFPDSFILKFNNMSDKALYHQIGIEAVKNEETGKYEDISPLINKLELEIQEIEEKIEEENSKDSKQKDRKAIRFKKSGIKSKEKDIEDLKSKAVKIIDLDNKAFIFLDTPNENLFNNLMSILSQDSRDQLYIFTDKDSSGKRLQARTVLLRGSPLIMTTQVVDDTRNYRFQEKNRRFIHINPNTSEDKIEEAMRQISIKLSGLPDDFESIVSTKDIDKSKELIENLCIKLKDNNQRYLDNNITGNAVKIPYSSILSSNLSLSDSWSMTVLTRLLNYIAIITKVNMDSRPKIIDVETGVVYPISIYDDLKEALEIMKTASLSIRPYQQEWYTNIFLPAFEELGSEPSCKINEDGCEIEKENVVGITTKQLAEYMNHQGKNIANSLIYENYLRPLNKQGIINSVKSIINGKENLHFPVNQGDHDDLSITSTLPLTEDCQLIVNSSFDEKKILEESLVTLLEQRRSNEGGEKYKIIDDNGSEISTDGLIEKYFFNKKYHTSCSVIVLVKPSDSNVKEEEEGSSAAAVDKQTKENQDDENGEQEIDVSLNKFINSPTNVIKPSNTSCYPYTKKDIEEFFSSDTGQQKEHTLEESIGRPLIGKQRSIPFFYYCKEHPTVEFIHLESIEDHIRLKDPESHKLKLLELLQEEERLIEEKSGGQDNKNKDSFARDFLT